MTIFTNHTSVEGRERWTSLTDWDRSVRLGRFLSVLPALWPGAEQACRYDEPGLEVWVNGFMVSLANSHL